MKAKDTVMNVGDFPNKVLQDELEQVARQQAEISFKAGTKEVVDYLRKRIILSGQTDAPFTPPKKIRYVDFLPISYGEWQAKLKEWGIDG